MGNVLGEPTGPSDCYLDHGQIMCEVREFENTWSRRERLINRNEEARVPAALSQSMQYFSSFVKDFPEQKASFS